MDATSPIQDAAKGGGEGACRAETHGGHRHWRSPVRSSTEGTPCALGGFGASLRAADVSDCVGRCVGHHWAWSMASLVRALIGERIAMPTRHFGGAVVRVRPWLTRGLALTSLPSPLRLSTHAVVCGGNNLFERTPPHLALAAHVTARAFG